MASTSIYFGLFPLKHLIRNGILAVASGFVLLMVFGGGTTPLSHPPPPFPFSYEHITYCGQVVAFGPCYTSIQDNLGLEAVDFLFWLGLLSFGVFELIGLLSSPVNRDMRAKFSLNKRRILGLTIIGMIAFSIFVPILPVPGATYTVCDYRAGYCRTITNYGSLTYLFLCTGTQVDTTGHYWWQGCMYF